MGDTGIEYPMGTCGPLPFRCQRNARIVNNIYRNLSMGDTGIEPVTFSMSTKRSTDELIALFPNVIIRFSSDNFNCDVNLETHYLARGDALFQCGIV